MERATRAASDKARVIHFPTERISRQATATASLLDIVKSRLRYVIGSLLKRLHIPGAIKDIDLQDSITGQKVSVQVSSLFVRLSVNGRDYYFDRLSGKFDGTGHGPV
jgi:hypothetical protein